MKKVQSWRDEYNQEIEAALVGQTVVDTTDDTLILSDGTRLRFEKETSDCCSWLELASLSPVPNIITAAHVEDNEDATGGEGAYKAWIRVVTEAGELNVAEAHGDASNGYYLHGFALDVTIDKGDGSR